MSNIVGKKKKRIDREQEPATKIDARCCVDDAPQAQRDLKLIQPV